MFFTLYRNFCWVSCASFLIYSTFVVIYSFTSLNCPLNLSTNSFSCAFIASVASLRTSSMSVWSWPVASPKNLFVSFICSWRSSLFPLTVENTSDRKSFICSLNAVTRLSSDSRSFLISSAFYFYALDTSFCILILLSTFSNSSWVFLFFLSWISTILFRQCSEVLAFYSIVSCSFESAPLRRSISSFSNRISSSVWSYLCLSLHRSIA